MGKNRYFLMFRDKNSNEVKSIPFSSNEIVGDGNRDSQCENNLCYIDLYTTMFRNKSELIVYLNRKGIVDCYDADIFICSRNGDNINMMECVYGDSCYKNELRSIAAYKRKNESDNRSINLVFDDFSRRMYVDDNFYNYVIYGFSNIYPKFIDYYKESRDISDMLNSKLRDGAWATTSYHLIHNIIDAYTGFRRCHGNVFSVALHEKESLARDRNSVFESIKVITAKGYDAEQLSLFGEDKSVDKLSYVVDNLDKLRVEAFTEYNGVKFNGDFFQKYEGEAFKNEICNLLDEDTLSSLLNYARDYKAFTSFKKDGVLDYKTRLDRDRLLLLNDFRVNPALLDRVYSFFLLYNKCMKDNEMDSGEYGRTYNKK